MQLDSVGVVALWRCVFVRSWICGVVELCSCVVVDFG